MLSMWGRRRRVVERREGLKPLAARDQPSQCEGLAVRSLHEKPRVGKLVTTDAIFCDLDARRIRIHLQQRLLPNRGLRGYEDLLNLVELFAIDVCGDFNVFINKRKASELNLHTP